MKNLTALEFILLQSALLKLSLGSTGVGGLGGGSESTEMPNLPFTSLALLCLIVKASGMNSCHLILASALTASSIFSSASRLWYFLKC